MTSPSHENIFYRELPSRTLTDGREVRIIEVRKDAPPTYEHPRRTARLRRLKLSEVSLVDRPANPLSVISLAKRDLNRSAVSKTAPPANDRFGQMTKSPPAPASFGSFEEAVTFLKGQGATGTDAMVEARKLHPALYDRYQEVGTEIAKAAADDFNDQFKKASAVTAFEKLCDQIARERRVPMLKAMVIARNEHPIEYAAYQQA